MIETIIARRRCCEDAKRPLRQDLVTCLRPAPPADGSRDSNRPRIPESTDNAGEGGVAPSAPDRFPRLPVLSRGTLARGSSASPPCLLDEPGVVFTTSGSAAIMLALEALGIASGDCVLVPTYHCPSMISPIARRGALPVFYPIDRHGAPDLAYLERLKIRRAKALIAVHYFGLPQAMSSVRRFCDERGYRLIEDCAHALFGDSEGARIGSHGAFAVGSLTKFLPAPEGGCLIDRSNSIQESELESRSSKAELKAWVDMLELGARFGRLGRSNALLLALFRMKNLLRRAFAPDRLSESGQPASASRSDDFDLALAHARSTRVVRWLAMHVDRQRIVSARRRNYGLLAERLAGLPGARPLFPCLPMARCRTCCRFGLTNRTPDTPRCERSGCPCSGGTGCGRRRRTSDKTKGGAGLTTYFSFLVIRIFPARTWTG